MKRKIFLIFIVLLFSVSFVCAENNNDNIADSITPVSISDNGIQFSDGFIGFCLDSDSNDLTTSDTFTLSKSGGNSTVNNVKLAIIECYKQGKENNIGSIVEKVIKGDTSFIDNAKDEKIGNNKVAELNNGSKATFNFELLKPTDDNKSDCLAYTVSIKAPDNPDNSSDDNKSDTEPSKDPSKNTDNSSSKKASDDKNKTITNETNKTEVNKTNTLIIQENNTTIIHHNTVTTIDNTTNGTPENNTLSNLLKSGNSILILIIVIVVIVIVAVGLRRRD